MLSVACLGGLIADGPIHLERVEQELFSLVIASHLHEQSSQGVKKFKNLVLGAKQINDRAEVWQDNFTSRSAFEVPILVHEITSEIRYLFFL